MLETESRSPEGFRGRFFETARDLTDTLRSISPHAVLNLISTLGEKTALARRWTLRGVIIVGLLLYACSADVRRGVQDETRRNTPHFLRDIDFGDGQLSLSQMPWLESLFNALGIKRGQVELSYNPLAPGQTCSITVEGQQYHFDTSRFDDLGELVAIMGLADIMQEQATSLGLEGEELIAFIQTYVQGYSCHDNG